MIGKLHITTLLGPRDSAGSSLATVGCGVGENQPACTGRPGSDTSIACKPPECHESKTIVRVGVGLWEEYEVNSFSAGAGEYAVVFCRILYSPSTCGRRGWAMFQVRTQPHGQPKDGAVNVPYTSSMVMANGRPGSGTAEWLSAQPAGVWPAQCGPVPHVGDGTLGYFAGVEHAEPTAQVREVGPGAVDGRRHGVQRQVVVVVRRIRRAREELVPVPLGDLGEDTGPRPADVRDDEVRDVGVCREGRRGQPQQRPRRVLGVEPQVHLVRLARRHVGRHQTRMHRVGQVEETNPPGVRARRAGVDERAAAEVHHHQQLLLRPHPQLARALTDVGPGDELLAELSDHRRGRRVRGVDDQNAGMRVRTRVEGHVPSRVAHATPTRTVGTGTDVYIPVVHRERRVHPTAEQRVRPDEREVRRRGRGTTARTDAHIGVRGSRRGQDKGEDAQSRHQFPLHRYLLRPRTGAVDLHRAVFAGAAVKQVPWPGWARGSYQMVLTGEACPRGTAGPQPRMGTRRSPGQGAVIVRCRPVPRIYNERAELPDTADGKDGGLTAPRFPGTLY